MSDAERGGKDARGDLKIWEFEYLKILVRN